MYAAILKVDLLSQGLFLKNIVLHKYVDTCSDDIYQIQKFYSYGSAITYEGEVIAKILAVSAECKKKYNLLSLTVEFDDTCHA